MKGSKFSFVFTITARLLYSKPSRRGNVWKPSFSPLLCDDNMWLNGRRVTSLFEPLLWLVTHIRLCCCPKSSELSTGTNRKWVRVGGEEQGNVYTTGYSAHRSTSCAEFELSRTELKLLMRSSDHLCIISLSCFFLPLSKQSSRLLAYCFFFSPPIFPPCRAVCYLMALSAYSILFALLQDKHRLCVTPKTFHRLSGFQRGPDISVIGFFLLGEWVGSWKKKKI